MPKAEPQTYAEQIAVMRQERHQRETAERVHEIEADYANIIEQRDSAEDPQDWAYLDQQAEQLETEYSQLAPPQPQVPAYTDTEQDIIRQYSPQQYGQSSWLMKSKYGPRLSNEEAVKTGANFAQVRFVQERAARGVPTSAEDLTAFRDSPAYRQALEVFAPPEQGGLPTPDSIIEDIKKTSKYGRDLDAKKYNQQVRKMDKLGKRGEYDR